MTSWWCQGWDVQVGQKEQITEFPVCVFFFLKIIFGDNNGRV